MNRTDAERVFSLVAEIGGDVRGRIVSERWWLVWIVIGIQILGTSTLMQTLLWSGERRPLIYGGLWLLQVLLIPPIIFFIHRRGGGQRPDVETYIWWIWVTFAVCVSGMGLFNQLIGLPLFFDAPLLGLLAAFAFSMMAMVTHRFYLACSLIFLLVMCLMIFFPSVQVLIYGLTWFLLLLGNGISFRLTRVPHSARSL